MYFKTVENIVHYIYSYSYTLSLVILAVSTLKCLVNGLRFFDVFLVLN